jgi:hypothetical protein
MPKQLPDRAIRIRKAIIREFALDACSGESPTESDSEARQFISALAVMKLVKQDGEVSLISMIHVCAHIFSARTA